MAVATLADINQHKSTKGSARQQSRLIKADDEDVYQPGQILDETDATDDESETLMTEKSR